MSQHQQGQQWQGGGDHLSSSSWNTGDTDYGFNNQFQHYQQQQQQQQQQQPQQWAAGQYVQPEQQGFLPQHAGYWPGYGEDHENQQMLANSGPNAMALNQNHFSVSDPKGKNNKVRVHRDGTFLTVASIYLAISEEILTNSSLVVIRPK